MRRGGRTRRRGRGSVLGYEGWEGEGDVRAGLLVARELTLLFSFDLDAGICDEHFGFNVTVVLGLRMVPCKGFWRPDFICYCFFF